MSNAMSDKAKEILLARLNEANNTLLKANNFDFSAPVVDLSHGDQVNTSLVISSKVGSGFYGEKTIYYKRTDLAELLKRGVHDLETTEFLLADIIPEVNELYSVKLEPIDYYNVNIPNVDSTNPLAKRIVPIIANPESLLFTGTCMLPLGKDIAPIVDQDNIIRNTYAVIEGLPVDKASKMFIRLKSNGDIDSSFNFLGNTNNISSFSIGKVFQLPNDRYILTGFFVFDLVLPTGSIQQITAASITVDNFGMVIGFENNVVFQSNLQLKTYEHRNYPYKFSINLASDSVSKIVRYFSNGLPDTDYVADIDFAPPMLAVDSIGRLYVVSFLYNSTILGITFTQRSISRLTQNGTVDTTFNPIYIRSSSSLYQNIDIADICFNDDGGFFVLFTSLLGVDAGSPCPVINDVPIVPLHQSATALNSWNPVVAFNDDGSINATFNCSLPQMQGSVVYDNVVNSPPANTKRLVSNGGLVTFFTKRPNPITGFTHIQPLQFNELGKPQLQSGQDYLNQYKLNTITGLEIFSNGEIVVSGQMQTLTYNGEYSTPYSAVAVYNADATIKQVLFKSINAVSLSNLTVSQIFIQEQPNA